MRACVWVDFAAKTSRKRPLIVTLISGCVSARIKSAILWPTCVGRQSFSAKLTKITHQIVRAHVRLRTHHVNRHAELNAMRGGRIAFSSAPAHIRQLLGECRGLCNLNVKMFTDRAVIRQYPCCPPHLFGRDSTTIYIRDGRVSTRERALQRLITYLGMHARAH